MIRAGIISVVLTLSCLTPVKVSGAGLDICPAASAAEDTKGLRAGRDGWLFAARDFRPVAQPTSQAAQYFTRLGAALAAKGQTLLLVPLPPRAMLSSRHLNNYPLDDARAGYESFLAALRSAGVQTLDISEQPPALDFYRHRDVHWTADGARYTAQLAAREIMQMPAYQIMSKQDFTLSANGETSPAFGLYDEALHRLCRSEVKPQSWPQWQTHTAAKDLLNDALTPAITLLGTSFSATDSTFDFAGALKRELKADVYNAALTGGGFGGAAISYFASTTYRAYPPKVIIWEFPARNDHNGAKAATAFRQMIPAIQSSCAEAIATDEGTLAAEDTDILAASAGKDLTNTYLHLTVEDPTERTLKIEALYADGSADEADLSRSTRAMHEGVYFYELSAQTAPIYIRLKTNIPEGRYTARLCKYNAGAQ